MIFYFQIIQKHHGYKIIKWIFYVTHLFPCVEPKIRDNQ